MIENKKRKPSILIIGFFTLILFEILGEALFTIEALGDYIVLPVLYVIGFLGILVAIFVVRSRGQKRSFTLPFQRVKTTQTELAYTFVNCPSCKIENHSTNYMCTHCGETLREEII